MFRSCCFCGCFLLASDPKLDLGGSKPRKYAGIGFNALLEAALEGSASAKAENAIIYATSNRRHIVRESFADREGGDVHRNDSMQEALSLSERFGLTILFGRPNQQLYLQIVRELAEKKGVQMPQKELETKAEAFALARGTRSARCAEQFINSLL